MIKRLSSDLLQGEIPSLKADSLSQTPRLEINLAKIEHNAQQLTKRLGALNIKVTGVTKGVLGCPKIAAAMLRGGVHSIGDSRIENIKKCVRRA